MSGTEWMAPNFSGYDISQKQLTKYKNNFFFNVIFNRFYLNALKRYKIEGLPDTCNERVVKNVLLNRACVSFVDVNDNLLSLPVAPGGSLNPYAEWSNGYAYTYTGDNFNVDFYLQGSDESEFLKTSSTGIKPGGKYKAVLVRENPNYYPFINTVIFYASQVADSFAALDTTRQNIKRPYIVTAEESIVNTVKEYFKRRDNNESFIINSGIFPTDKIDIMELTAPDTYLKTLTSVIDWYENKFKEACGITNSGASADKKGENLLTGEINSNNEYTDFNIDLTCDYIQEGLDIVNKLYGTSMKCVKYFNEKEAEQDESDDIFGDSGTESESLSRDGSR